MSVFSDEYGIPREQLYQLTRFVAQYLNDLEFTGLQTISASTHTVAEVERNLTVNFAGTCTVTLPTASSYPGRVIWIRTITANTVVSASSNVVPLAGGAAGTAILAATAGRWARLVSYGSNWRITAAN